MTKIQKAINIIHHVGTSFDGPSTTTEHKRYRDAFGPGLQVSFDPARVMRNDTRR